MFWLEWGTSASAAGPYLELLVHLQPDVPTQAKTRLEWATVILIKTSGINLDPVIPHLGPDHLSRRFRGNGSGRFHRHMAIDAIVLNLVAHGLGHAATLNLMATEAAAGVGRRRTLWLVFVVASGAAHAW